MAKYGLVDVKIHTRVVGKVFKTPAVVNRLEDMANAIKDEANAKTDALYPKNSFDAEHFGVWRYTTSHGNTGVAVGTRSKLGRAAQARHSVLTQSMDAGRR